MAQNDLDLTFSDNSTVESDICSRCGRNAEMRLALLGSASHANGTFCLACAEALIHELRKQHFVHAEQAAGFFSGLAGAGVVHKSFLHSDTAYDEIEGGIIFWEGHGWSSDGPFAGA